MEKESFDQIFSQMFESTLNPIGSPIWNESLPLTACFMGCGDKEGWGPISSKYADFTPCFLQGFLGLLMGFLFLVLSIHHCIKLRNRKVSTYSNRITWSFYAKLLLSCLQIIFYVIIQSSYKKNDSIRIAQWVDILDGFPILALLYLQQFKSLTSNGVVLFYWAWEIILRSGTFMGLYLRNKTNTHLFAFNLICVVNACLILFIELSFPLIQKDPLKFRKYSPYDRAHIFAKLTFTWMDDIMKKGYSQFLTEKDIPYLPNEIKSKVTATEFRRQWNKQKRGSKSLFYAISLAFGDRVLQGTIFKIFMDILGFAQPQLLRYLIKFVNDYSQSKNDPTLPDVPITRGFMLSLGMFVVSASQTLIAHQYYQRSFDLGMKIKTSLTSVIYSKALVLSNDARQKSNTGDIVNIMAVDVQRLQDLVQNIQIAWSGPFQIILCLISLHKLLGSSVWIAFFVMVLLIPVNSQIARKQKQLQSRQMIVKDERSSLVSEILNNIKSIKFYSWETPYLEKLNYVRNEKELKNLKSYGIVSSISIFTAYLSPFVVSCSTFGLFVILQKKTLSTDIVFPALALFNLLNLPLAVLPLVVSNVVESQVAIKRITDFLNSKEIQTKAVVKLPRVDKLNETVVEIKDGSFSWSESNSKLALDGINLIGKKGQFDCIVGKVGSGKSSLLQAILGELHKVKGSVKIHGSVAYVPQVPWIINTTVRENILFGHKFDPEFYHQVLTACSLTKDFETLTHGDLTEVGEKGISLSGGQKARISLARAIYSGADVYILDDPLSAVDEHVGRHLMDNVLGANGLLKTKCRIMATNNLKVLGLSNSINLISEGRIIQKASYLEVLTSGKGTPLYELFSEFGKGNKNMTQSESLGSVSELPSEIPSRRGSLVLVDNENESDEEGELNDDEVNRKKENSEQGKVKWNVYLAYFKACNPKASALFLIMLIASNVFAVLSNVWLKHWSEVNTEEGRNPRVSFYLSIFILLGFLSSFFALLQNGILWIYCTICGSKVLHQGMARKIMKAPMSFFESTPIGRILNRFSNDIYKVDEQMGRVFGLFFSSLAKVLFTIFVICFSTWPFIFVVFPLVFLYIHYQQYYLRSSRELRRLDAVSRSPIFSSFQESLVGVSSIRAYQQQERFKNHNQILIDKNMRAFNPSVNANRWLAVRLEFIGSIIIFAASAMATLMLTKGNLTAGIVGLSVSYSLQITQTLGTIVRQTVEVETNIVSVERILEYSNIKSEAPYIIEDNRPNSNWPSSGEIVFNDYSTKYRPELDPVLRNISFAVKSKEKIGIVGRTGAGKSSLTLALFRIIESFSGNITLENLDIGTIGLADLRTKLSIIPQDSQVFQGTIKSNLDPTNIFTDDEIWRALEHSHLKDHILRMKQEYNEVNEVKLSSGLEVPLTEGGSNLSVGQRQLICLARALLIKSPILILDEATAAVDVETDRIIQQTIRREFKDRTILTIAHRLDTIMDSDKILVLEKGQVAEFDSPSSLLESKSSLFYLLCKEGGFVSETI